MAMSPRLLRPRATGFNPSSISGIVHWWDANDSSSVLLNSGFVESWTSKVGAKTVATQTTPNNRPDRTTVNGKTAILFDGSNDGLSFTGTARTDETWIIAAAQTADQTGTRALINDGTAGDGILVVKTGGPLRLLEASWTAGVASGSTDGVARLRAQIGDSTAPMLPPSVITVTRSSGGNGRVFRNGSQLTSVVNGSTTMSNSGSITIARIGSYSSTTFQFQGWIGEIFCYSRMLSDTERQAAERYLGKKWGITVA